MERVEYDPEIDPSIREEREAAEREMELTNRIRLEIKRYVEEHDLVPREQAADQTLDADNAAETVGFQNPPRKEVEETTAPETPRERRCREREERREAKRETKERRTTERRKAVRSVFTGSILSSDWMRRMWPWLLGLAVIMVLYIAGTFHLQQLQLERGRLEREVRELEVKAMERTAERVRETRRSAIVERLGEKNIPLEEFPRPVKTIKRDRK